MFMQKPSLEEITPQWDAPENVHAFFTTRNGGVSAGPWGGADGFNGLNLATHVGDSSFTVKMNRKMVAEKLPGEPKWLEQVHSCTAVDAAEVEDVPAADASFTNVDNVVCVVMTADCVPVLLCDTAGRGVAAVHAGWKGLNDGVIQTSVKALREKIGDENAEILAWIGPCIRKDAFVVQEDTVAAFRAGTVAESVDAALEKREDGYRLDLPMLATAALKQAGVERVSDSGLCTYSDASRFYSYRRDGECGRHGAFIWLA